MRQGWVGLAFDSGELFVTYADNSSSKTHIGFSRAKP